MRYIGGKSLGCFICKGGQYWNSKIFHRVAANKRHKKEERKYIRSLENGVIFKKEIDRLS